MPSKTDLLRRERDDQRKLADHWKLQHDDYKKLNAKLASRAEDLEAEVSRLTAEVERLRSLTVVQETLIRKTEAENEKLGREGQSLSLPLTQENNNGSD